ncbi:MAG: molybdenum cofactor biosynthesis protein B [Vicinamibacterales bacterium]|nr:molybdenum cofactor biosynthesis protein [Acidobacteriota bacterium]MDP6373851.1 molybdenum cofactor biosynthesis protein B [Vicinamibacterales bacterium]MDP6607768.1 molybdenum cofactor biosynthesis protein B [Vicinamibacterales bacterium]HAK55353.1 molybdenum cofactor biosynthesis protein [Acidobacteriota bacterium]
MSHREHRAQSPTQVRCYVLTVSDSRTEETDAGGRAIVELLTSAGHEVVDRRIVKDEPDQVRAAVALQFAHERVQAIITTGGTGISSRDRSYEAVTGLLEKRLDGFGEIFRALSFEEIGPAAMLSRAFAGTAHGKILIALPGSEHAVRLALTKLVLPELGHLVREASR